MSSEENLILWLKAQQHNSFAQDLVKWYGDKGYLSPRQLAAAKNLRDSRTTNLPNGINSVNNGHRANDGYDYDPGWIAQDQYERYLRQVAEDEGLSFDDFMDRRTRD